MAMCDYRLCDVCGGKAFYDANLNYEQPDKDGKFEYDYQQAFRVAGEVQPFGYSLNYIGDWAVICTECSKTHKCVIVPVSQAEIAG